MPPWWRSCAWPAHRDQPPGLLCIDRRARGLWREARRRRSLPGMTEQGDRPLVLVDVRPTECGYRALLWALREAERRDAVLLAVTAWPGDPAEPDDGRAEMEQALTAMVE